MTNTLFSTVRKHQNRFVNFIVYTKDGVCLGNHYALSWAVATALVFDVDVEAVDYDDDTLKITLAMENNAFTDKIADIANEVGLVGLTYEVSDLQKMAAL